MLGNPPVLPTIFGAKVPELNNTSLKTTGWELSLMWHDVTPRGFDYSIRVSLSDDRSVITKYENSSRGLDEYYTGKKIGQIWGYKSMGIAKSDREMKNHLVSLPNGGQSALGGGWTAGDMMYNDVNGDGRIDNGANTLDDHGDLVVIGNDQPRFRLSLDFNAAFKGFDFRMFWQGVLKQDYSPGSQQLHIFRMCRRQHLVVVCLRPAYRLFPRRSQPSPRTESGRILLQAGLYRLGEEPAAPDPLFAERCLHEVEKLADRVHNPVQADEEDTDRKTEVLRIGREPTHHNRPYRLA